MERKYPQKHELYPSTDDIYLFHQGTLYQSYRLLGAHLYQNKDKQGVRFTVWAPNARQVSVIGNFNSWHGDKHSMEKIKNTGIWITFIENLKIGDIYKYQIETADGRIILKSDPYAFYAEIRPESASRIYPIDNYDWHDDNWQKTEQESYHQPLLIYEVHLGSWKRKEDGSFYNYRELAEELVDYVLDKGYTHIELMPICEHPYDRSWGYQLTGYYAVTSRYGNPDDFKYFVDYCHQKGIGVIIDWVPGHFCKDEHGLREFDGSPIYEYRDWRKSEKEEWGTLSFDFGRGEVQSFLISNAMFWHDIYHIDGIRVDAVASMLYLDFGKKEGQWVTNHYGGRENLEAISFLQKLNKKVFEKYPDSLMIAEESSEYPLVSSPVHIGGLGFNYKWNMGWMNDVLKYMELDPIYRKFHHNLLTFSLFYAYSENFVLALSHDEVVYGKRSLLNKMPGDYWQKFANLRAFYGFYMAHPGKKLLFMGGEFAQFDEWKDFTSLDWDLLEYPLHKKMANYVRELNRMYLKQAPLWDLDHEQEGFSWIDPNNNEQSIISFIRKARNGDFIVIICNFTPQYYEEYRVGVPEEGTYREIFNSDQEEYGGSNQKNSSLILTQAESCHGQNFHISIKVPPLSTVFLKKEKEDN